MASVNCLIYTSVFVMSHAGTIAQTPANRVGHVGSFHCAHQDNPLLPSFERYFEEADPDSKIGLLDLGSYARQFRETYPEFMKLEPQCRDLLSRGELPMVAEVRLRILVSVIEYYEIDIPGRVVEWLAEYREGNQAAPDTLLLLHLLAYEWITFQKKHHVDGSEFSEIETRLNRMANEATFGSAAYIGKLIREKE